MMKTIVVICLLVTTVTANVLPLRNLPMENPSLFEGDIMGISSPEERNAVVNKNLLWANGQVPYVIDSSLNEMKSKIQESIQHYHSRTCIRFKERTTETNYVHMFKGIGCYSFVGNFKQGGQKLSLGPGCGYLGTIVHELGHAIGFWHEQNRSDRDDYLIIYWSNIKPGMESNFRKLFPEDNNLFGISFDYNSIMLYGEYSFSKDGVLKTMKAKIDNVTLKEPYEKNGLSASDILRIKKLYHC